MRLVDKLFNNCPLAFKMFYAKHAHLRKFNKDFNSPRQVQSRLLQDILKYNQNDTIGQKYNFDSISSDKEFLNSVPIHTYEDLRPYIEEFIEKKGNEKCIFCLQTSGTTGKPKYIPLTQETIQAYKKVQLISTCIQYHSVPGIFSGNLLAIVSPLVEGQFPNGIPYGSMSAIVGLSLDKEISNRSILPEEVLAIADYDVRYLVIAIIAIADASISCLASANPSTFIRLNEVINQNLPKILLYLETGSCELLDVNLDTKVKEMLEQLCRKDGDRVSQLKNIWESKGSINFVDLWPKLKAVVTWTSGNCSLLIPKLKAEVAPGVAIVEMGYMASECWGSIIIDTKNNLGVPNIQNNFFEFIEPENWDNGRLDTKLIDEIVVGQQYYLIFTNRNSLYRYFINDIVKVTGRFRGTPTIEFVQKGKGVTSLTGEKLYEGQVVDAVLGVVGDEGIDLDGFILLADRDSFSYTLYLESKGALDEERFAARFNSALSDINLEYSAKLKSSRIKPAKVVRVKAGTFEEHKKASIKAGQREGQYKAMRLQYADEIVFPFWESELK